MVTVDGPPRLAVTIDVFRAENTRRTAVARARIMHRGHIHEIVLVVDAEILIAHASDLEHRRRNRRDRDMVFAGRSAVLALLRFGLERRCGDAVMRVRRRLVNVHLRCRAGASGCGMDLELFFILGVVIGKHRAVIKVVEASLAVLVVTVKNEALLN